MLALITLLNIIKSINSLKFRKGKSCVPPLQKQGPHATLGINSHESRRLLAYLMASREQVGTGQRTSV